MKVRKADMTMHMDGNFANKFNKTINIIKNYSTSPLAANSTSQLKISYAQWSAMNDILRQITQLRQNVDASEKALLVDRLTGGGNHLMSVRECCKHQKRYGPLRRKSLPNSLNEIDANVKEGSSSRIQSSRPSLQPPKGYPRDESRSSNNSACAFID